MKTAITIASVILLSMNIGINHRFYHAAPYNGIGADIERIVERGYTVTYEDGMLTKNKRISRTATSKYNESGQVYESNLTIYDGYMTIVTNTSFEYYDDNNLFRSTSITTRNEKKTISTKECIEYNDSMAIYTNKTLDETLNVEKIDTTSFIYNYENQSAIMTLTSGHKYDSKFITYYENNREVKNEAYEDGRVQSSQTMIYDENFKNLLKVIVIRGNHQISVIEFKYSKFDDKGNWTEGEMYQNDSIKAVLERSIFYR